jgi:hypothetical protein
MQPTPPDPLPPRPQSDSEVRLVSFVVRFVSEAPAAQAPQPATHWHGVIRHVQSNLERRFTVWDEAVAFIVEYVSLNRPAE